MPCSTVEMLMSWMIGQERCILVVVGVTFTEIAKSGKPVDLQTQRTCVPWLLCSMTSHNSASALCAV